MSDSSSSGISFIGLLTIVFVALKLMGYIAWSWWWVLSPLWIPWAMFFCGFLIYMLVVFGKFVVETIIKYRDQ